MNKTQARVEGKNQQVVRADLRVPVDLYAQIEAIAVEEGMKPHHITGRPMVSPVILELIEVGLRHWGDRKQQLPDTVPDRVPDTNLDLDSLKAELLEQLRGELEAIAEKKLSPSPMN